jgi:hypothetical protein
MNNSEIKQKFKQRIIEILKLESRIPRLYKSMNDGDVSPFFIELFGEEITFKIKLGQSIQTTIGMSIYEQFCKTLGESVGYKVELQKKIYGSVNSETASYINTLLNNLDYIPNRQEEMMEIRKLSTPGEAIEFPDSTVDVYITTPQGREFLIDITTVKPNKKSFRALKHKLLYWQAIRLSQDINAVVEPYFAIPYNPESIEPEGTKYNMWSKYYDRKDILVGDELWMKVSNNNFSILDIIEVFKSVSVDMNLDLKDAFKGKN